MSKNFQKETGIAVPLFSLPGKYGVGDLASLRDLIHRICNFPVDIIQFLPLNCLGPFEISPYSSISAFANEIIYIDIDLLTATSVIPEQLESNMKVDYANARKIKTSVLRDSYKSFLNSSGNKESLSFEQFKSDQNHWLKPYCNFHYLLDHYRCAYWDWPIQYTNFQSFLETENETESDFYAYVQWIFYEQWQALRSEAKQLGIRLMGDLPIYVSKNSADVWSKPDLFQEGIHAGVPPDLYSEEGQDWGNPIYDWDLMQRDNFLWWRQRMEWLKEFFDIVRVDHIRGLHDYWAVKDGYSPKDTTQWTKGPRDQIINALRESGVEIIGEDLGLITEQVEEWMQRLEVPGYRVFIFGWGWYAEQGKDYGALKYKNPDFYPRRSLCCSSTHDSESLREFLENLNPTQTTHLCDFFSCSPENLRENILKSLDESPSRYVINPLQDLLNLAIRINTPGSVGEQNWSAIIPLENLENRLEEYFND